MLKQFTMAKRCPIREALSLAQFHGEARVSLKAAGGAGKYVKYDVLKNNQVIGRVFGSGWTSGQFAAFVLVNVKDKDFDFDQEIRLESRQQLSSLFSLLASSSSTASALESFEDSEEF